MFNKVIFTKIAKNQKHYLKNLRISGFNKFIIKTFSKEKINEYSTSDEMYWEEYRKRKLNKIIVPPLGAQEFKINEIVHSWRYSANHSLASEELYEALAELEPGNNIVYPFVVLDVREESEFDLFLLPKITKVDIFL